MLVIRSITRTFSTRSTEILLQPEPRLLKVAIIGMPNAGKSTLINQLLASEVCPVSKRAHTTRESQKAIYLRDNTQVVFVDTPGVVSRKETKKFELPETFTAAPETAIENADVVGVIHDVSNRILRHKLDHRLVKVLEKHKEKDSILILNKVDTIKAKRSLLDAVRFLTKSTVGGVPIPMAEKRSRRLLGTEDILERARMRSVDRRVNLQSEKSADTDEEDGNYTEFEINGWAGFNDVFMISALTGDGINLLEDYFVSNAKPCSWEFDEKVLTDVPPMELALKILKSKMLEYLPQEIPYTVIPSLDFWEEGESGSLRIVFGIKCPNERFVKIVIGQKGRNINQIQQAVEKSLTELLRKEIDLHIKALVEEKEKAKKD